MAAKFGQMVGGFEGNLDHALTYDGKKTRKWTFWIALVICLIISAIVLGFMYNKDSKKPKKERKPTYWWVLITCAFIFGSPLLAWFIAWWAEFTVTRNTSSARQYCDGMFNVEVNKAEAAAKQRQDPYYIQCVENKMESNKRERERRYDRFAWNNNRGGGGNLLNDFANAIIN